jgi:probable F420-dependent oxidoreductase
MDYGLVLPNMLAGASAEGIEAAAEAAERLGYTTVWTTDHVLVDHASADEYGRIFDAILTLAHVGARTTKVRLGTSVIVVPQRQAVVLAKELATLDVLSRGRVVAGVGIGWTETEFANLGAADRFHRRGAYLDEAIRLWRHLWSGSQEPFHGKFHDLTDFVFDPLPVQGEHLPILVGGRSDAAYRRAGRLGDAYHFSTVPPEALPERLALANAEAAAAGRTLGPVSGRVTMLFDTHELPAGVNAAAMGTPEEIAVTVRAYRDIGVGHLGLVLRITDPDRYVATAERFMREVVPLVG